MPPSETSELFNQAARLHEAGRLTEAESLYRRILALESGHADALHLLGVVAYQTGRKELAADLIGRAIGINAGVAAYHSNLGNALKDLGHREAALASYDAALRLKPDYADAHYNRGSALVDLERFDEAVASYDAALRIKPDHAKAFSSRGNALKSLGRLDEALESYEVALRIRPDYALAHNNRGNVLKDLGRSAEAETAYDSALRFKPDYAAAHSNRGELLKHLGRFVEALAAHDAALKIDPEDAKAHFGRGNALTSLGRLDDALISFDAALQLRPEYVEAYNNRGNALANLGRLDEALASYEAALRLNPDYVEAHTNRGSILKDLGRFDEAILSLSTALSIKPDYADAHNNLIYCLHYDPAVDGKAIRTAAQSFGALFDAASAPFPNSPDPARRLRVGLVSGDLGRHPVGYFLLPFLSNRARCDTEVYCYATHPRNDAVTANLMASADHWRSLVGLSDSAAAAQIRADAIDILIDLSGHTAHNRLPLFARRAAPVQATWLGYWGTTGISAMDYILSDPVTIPPGMEDLYCERVVRLADGRFCYAPPSYAPDPAPPPCLRPADQRALDLRDSITTFGSFNNLGKVGPEVVALWAAVLHAVPGARLLLKWRSLADEGARHRLTQAFSLHGIGADRLALRGASPHPQMLAEYGDMDVALDTFPFSGGLTSCEALWMGVPVVTLPGAVGPSRQTLGFLKAMALEEWAAGDAADYVRIAAALAADREHLRELRQSLRPRMAVSPLCDGPAFARSMEAELRTMWRNWCTQRNGVP